MPRKKKDGRFINYYIDRQIFERLEHYAAEKGQQMTTAIERILEDHLDRYEAERTIKGGTTMYCPNCNVLVNATKCPICGNRNIREPVANDYCFLVEKELIWAGALEDILSQNGIPFTTQNVLGAGLAAKMGPALERTRFYVPLSHYETAHELVQEFFSADMESVEFDSSTEDEE